jgi:phosphoglycolate phosphatase-like HAD superfamily hydrolase
MMTDPPLFLFDIDGTLVRKSGPHHREVLVDAVRDVAHLETTTDNIPLQGMLDRDIIACMMRNAGESEGRIRRLMPAIVRHAQALYVNCCPSLRGKVCPGVRMFLSRVKRRGIRAGLVTGNLSAIGWHKVEKAGLREHFTFGAFADQGRTRAELARRAIRYALRHRWITGKSPILLFGDHENDILAAKANGIRSVAVATGISSPIDLARLQPDFLFDDLRGCPLDRILV